MRGSVVLSMLLTVLILSGCLGSGPEDTVDVPLGVTANIREGIPGPDELGVPDLVSTPEWIRGEWWTYRGTLELGFDLEVTAIVADATETEWLVGIHPDDPLDAAVLWHWPLIGSVGRDALTTDMHGAPFSYMPFPIEDGESWEVDYGAPATATASVINDTVVEVHVVGGVFPMHYVYDATMRNLVLVDSPGLGRFELIDHGYGYTGDTIVPKDLAFGFFQARAGVVVDASTPPAHPTGLGVNVAPLVSTAMVPERTDGGLMLFAGNFALPAASPGLYSERAVAPDGAEYVLQRTPDEGEGQSFSFHHVASPGGEWSFQHLAAGLGVVFAELYVYDRFDYTLDEGRMVEVR